MRALLDVNVVIVLLDGGQRQHILATAWLEQNIERGWASCPITETGFVRIMSQPAYPKPQPVLQAVERLAEACAHPSHAFWPQQRSVLVGGPIHWPSTLGPRQITDACLLALAVEMGGLLLSFGSPIDPATVPGTGPKCLCVINAQSI